MELLSEYGLFLRKSLPLWHQTIAAIAAIIVNASSTNKRQRGELRVNNLSEQYKMKEELHGLTSAKTVAQSAEEKAQARSESSKSESQTGRGGN
ncbi:hypothetical protein N5T09_23815 [Escherichia coli]|nr:hypothetical protein [Escherichia coli]MCW3371906.1 hypothetical protein [Escherichia coli]